MILRPPTFSQSFLKRIIHYDPATGIWTWKEDRAAKAKAGMRAGCVNKSDGRRYIKIQCLRFSESRLAWFYMKGTWPKKRVDHADMNPLNNCWKNLRLASVTENQANCKPRKITKGVTQVRTGKWTAQIQKAKQKMHLGTFDTPEEAHTAYKSAAVRLYGEFARGA